MYSQELLRHFRNPQNAGELPEATTTTLVENPACGDVLKLFVRFEEGRVTAIRYQAKGCPAAVAAGSVLTELLLELPPRRWHEVTVEQIDRRLGGLPPASRHAAQLAIDAVGALLHQTGR